MSEGLARAAAGDVSIELDGKVWLLSPLGLRDFATIEQEYLRQKPNPLMAVAEAKAFLDEEDYNRLLDKAYKDATSASKATNQEVSEWIDTRAGAAYSVWIALLKRYPEVEYEFVERFIEAIGEQQF